MLDQLHTQLTQGGAIMLPIGALAVVMWWLVFLKAWEIWILVKNEEPLTKNEQKKLKVTHEDIDPQLGWQPALTNDYLSSRSGIEDLDEELSRVLVDRHSGHVKKGIVTIIILAATAPLLGLLGTVSGMVDTFEVISIYGTSNAKGLASGISQALITTQSGLIVAIPGMVAGEFLHRRATAMKNRMTLHLNNIERTLTTQERKI
ncbi:MAG: MotA/TolQ/ExbB proton channel family protein [Desulfovibrio sp.]